MTETEDKLGAALTGMAVSAALHMVRQGRDATDRIDRNRDDLDALRLQVRDWLANGHVLRDTMPPVADFLSGIALSREQEPAPTLLPNFTKYSRPDLVSALQVAVPDFTWPPRQGEYTENGYIKKAGELVSLGVIVTYEEIRAILHGFVLQQQPNTEQKRALFFAANTLAAALAARVSWTHVQWRAKWEQIFGPAPHVEAPKVTAQVQTIGSQVVVAKDTAMVIKLTASAVVNAGTTVVKVTFGQKFTNVPAVIAGSVFYAEQVTEEGFVLINRTALAQGDVSTVPIVVGSTDG